jgi:DNA-binding winged helix-turn-helix (wHTH) protein/tetratricopeptide (TPR) repeat protein
MTAVHDPPEPSFAFAGFRLEPDGTLFRGQTVIHLPPKELAALRILLAHSGQVVTPLQLRRELWGDVHVTTDSVPKCLSSLRARLAPEDCLQTVYKRGYRLAAEVRSQLRNQPSALPRLAILPFEPAPGFPEHLALGAVEATIDRLVNMRPAIVSVLARDSVLALAQNRLTAQQVGKELEADFVLAGNLRALPAHFRLRAAMIRVEDGTEVWVEDLLVERNRSGALEADLIERLVFRLGAGPLPIAPADDSSQKPESSVQRWEAYDSYLRARYECQTLERHRMQDGLQHLVRATEIDPSLTSAQVDLAYQCCVQGIYGFMSPAVTAETVRRAAESVPQSSEQAVAMLPVRGWVSFHMDRDLQAASDSYARSAHLPHDSRISRLRVMYALGRHRFQEAIGLMQAALDEDPFSPLLHARMAWALHLAGQTEKSVEQIRRALSLFPGSEWTPLYGAMILCFHGDTAEGVELAAQFAERHPYFDIAAAVHAYALACTGCESEARTILERLRWLSRERFVLRSFSAAAYVALGDHEAALEEVRAADESRCPWFFQMLADPRLKPLAGYPGFERAQGILAQMESSLALAQ